MESEQVDLSALRIHRSEKSQDGPPKKLPAYIISFIVVLVLIAGGIYGGKEIFCT